MIFLLYFGIRESREQFPMPVFLSSEFFSQLFTILCFNFLFTLLFSLFMNLEDTVLPKFIVNYAVFEHHRAFAVLFSFFEDSFELVAIFRD